MTVQTATLKNNAGVAHNPTMLKKLKDLWMKFALAFGEFMSKVILTILYFTVCLPYGIGMRLFSDPLHIKGKPGPSNWKTLDKLVETVEKFRQQY